MVQRSGHLKKSKMNVTMAFDYRSEQSLQMNAVECLSKCCHSNWTWMCSCTAKYHLKMKSPSFLRKKKLIIMDAKIVHWICRWNNKIPVSFWLHLQDYLSFYQFFFSLWCYLMVFFLFCSFEYRPKLSQWLLYTTICMKNDHQRPTMKKTNILAAAPKY